MEWEGEFLGTRLLRSVFAPDSQPSFFITRTNAVFSTTKHCTHLLHLSSSRVLLRPFSFSSSLLLPRPPQIRAHPLRRGDRGSHEILPDTQEEEEAGDGVGRCRGRGGEELERDEDEEGDRVWGAASVSLVFEG